MRESTPTAIGRKTLVDSVSLSAVACKVSRKHALDARENIAYIFKIVIQEQDHVP